MGDSRAEDVARYFDHEACCASSRRPANGHLSGVSQVLLGLLDDVGVADRTVLDAGCGQGGLTVALGERGATSVTGIDLSPQSVAVATRAAEQARVPARFQVANAATDVLAPHDVVVLNKVVCCYHDAEALLANTLPAAGSVVALSLPRSRGVRGGLARLLLAAENGWRRLQGDPFRAVVHDEEAIMGTLDGSGWSLAAQRDLWIWRIAIFERQA